jgi:hypothetical protein
MIGGRSPYFRNLTPHRKYTSFSLYQHLGVSSICLDAMKEDTARRTGNDLERVQVITEIVIIKLPDGTTRPLATELYR